MSALSCLVLSFLQVVVGIAEEEGVVTVDHPEVVVTAVGEVGDTVVAGVVTMTVVVEATAAAAVVVDTVRRHL